MYSTAPGQAIFFFFLISIASLEANFTRINQTAKKKQVTKARIDIYDNKLSMLNDNKKF